SGKVISRRAAAAAHGTRRLRKTQEHRNAQTETHHPGSPAGAHAGAGRAVGPPDAAARRRNELLSEPDHGRRPFVRKPASSDRWPGCHCNVEKSQALHANTDEYPNTTVHQHADANEHSNTNGHS